MEESKVPETGNTSDKIIQVKASEPIENKKEIPVITDRKIVAVEMNIIKLTQNGIVLESDNNNRAKSS